MSTDHKDVLQSALKQSMYHPLPWYPNPNNINTENRVKISTRVNVDFIFKHILI